MVKRSNIEPHDVRVRRAERKALQAKQLAERAKKARSRGREHAVEMQNAADHILAMKPMEAIDKKAKLIVKLRKAGAPADVIAQFSRMSAFAYKRYLLMRLFANHHH